MLDNQGEQTPADFTRETGNFGDLPQRVVNRNLDDSDDDDVFMLRKGSTQMEKKQSNSQFENDSDADTVI